MENKGIHNLSKKYKGKKVVVFGLGKAGLSSIRLLLDAGVEIFACDDNTDAIDKCNLEFKSESNYNSSASYNDIWNDVDFLVLSPGIPLTHPKPHKIVDLAHENSCKIICDVELLYQYSPESKFIAITGTNGKSTTTALIGHVLKSFNINDVEVGGNIGVSASSLRYLGDGGIYVIEMSSYQLDLLDEAQFDISILLDISPDHLDRHGSMEGYIDVKKKIFEHTKSEGVSIVAIDDEYCQKVTNDFSGDKGDEKIFESKLITISGFGNNNSDIEVSDSINADSDNRILRIENNEYNIGKHDFLPGDHNMQNIAASCAVIYSLGYKLENLQKYISSFAGLEHRLQIVKTVGNITFINDSKATNAVSTKFALDSYKNLSDKKIIWIAGGVAKSGGIESLRDYFKYLDKVFLYGEAANDFSVILNDLVEYDICSNLTNVFSKLKNNSNGGELSKGSVVIFSPSCASFDQYKNFEERGKDFCRLVNEYDEYISGRSSI